ncbi:unnamed protein product [Cyprideis torosa]|uniref:Uncharacterized protein n=1 Tax=Cyprideis torosa TaxID=163714 RepID=A0A7R8W6M7_9CRUS|nr:unnamed protein product [Cyprideis torosa]CAG0886701.1 unnamed protein product [Cyprideis torosa]
MVLGYIELLFVTLTRVGLAAAVMAGWLDIYYIVILSWGLFYLYESVIHIGSELPWGYCGNDWNTEYCMSEIDRKINCKPDSLNKSISWCTLSFPNNATVLEINKKNLSNPVTEYWNNRVLQISSGITDVGGIQWELALTLALVWVLCYFCIWKGVKWTGKVVWFTALFPYVLMVILFIRAVTLEGATEGMKYYLTPKMDKLQEPQVWIDAFTQIFFSYGLALGSLIALGSYNVFHNNVYVIQLLVTAEAATEWSIVLDNLAPLHSEGEREKPPRKRATPTAEDEGNKRKRETVRPGLAFEVYPNAILQMPYPPIWAAVFFFMFILIGLDSQFCTMEGFITAIVDEFPHHLRGHKELFILGTAFFSYLVGLSCVTRIVFLFRLAYWLPMTYDPLKYTYPVWANVLGWFMALSSMIWIPIYFSYCFFQTSSELTFIERIKLISRPPVDLEKLRNKSGVIQDERSTAV